MTEQKLCVNCIVKDIINALQVKVKDYHLEPDGEDLHGYKRYICPQCGYIEFFQEKKK